MKWRILEVSGPFFILLNPLQLRVFLKTPRIPFRTRCSALASLNSVESFFWKPEGLHRCQGSINSLFFWGGGGWDGHPNFPASIGNPYNQCINPHSDWMDDRGHMSINDSCEKTSKSLTIWPQQQPAASLSIVPRPAAGTRGSSASLCDSSNEPSWYHIRTTWGLQMRKFWKNDSCQAVQRGNVATWQPWT